MPQWSALNPQGKTTPGSRHEEPFVPNGRESAHSNESKHSDNVDTPSPASLTATVDNGVRPASLGEHVNAGWKIWSLHEGAGSAGVSVGGPALRPLRPPDSTGVSPDY